MAVRILQYSYGGEQPSGIDSYLLDAYRGLDRSRFQFDFLYRYGCPLTAAQRAEVEAAGARVMTLDVAEHRHPVIRQLQEAVRLWRFFRKHDYDVVEINMTALFMILTAALIARAHGTRVRIAHAHDALPDEHRGKRLLKTLFRPLLDMAVTDRWACSAGAARYLFGARRAGRGVWELVVNGIDTARFAFDPVARDRVRTEFGLTDELCVGIVGRMTPQKNHLFALDVIAEVRRQRRAVRLLVVGDGPLRTRLQDRVAELCLEDAVIFAGVRADMPAVLSGMDVLLAPSLHEGFPIIGLEAQASGLPCIVSEAYPREANIIGAMTFLPLVAGPAAWTRHLTERLTPVSREAAHTKVTETGVDSADTAAALDAAYERFTARGIAMRPRST